MSGARCGRRDRTWIVESTKVSFEWWDVVDEDDVTCFQAWFYHADGALVFEEGTTTVRAQGIQYGSAWEIEGEWSPEQIAALGAAHRRASADHPGSDLAQHYAFEA
jgi:hypothetical protein